MVGNNDNNSMDDMLGAIIGFGLMNSFMKNKPGASVPPFTDTKAGDTHKAIVMEGAKAVKKIYDSYVAVGFNEVQAFELLKLVLSHRR